MIKFGKNTTVSEKFSKLMEQYEEFKKKIDELYVKLRTEEDGLICQDIRRVQKNFSKQQEALRPDLYKEFYRMFDKKYIKVTHAGNREPFCCHIDGVAIKKRGKKEEFSTHCVILDGTDYSVNTDKCMRISYNPLLAVWVQECLYPFTSYWLFGNEYKITEITKAEFDNFYKKSITSEQQSQFRKTAGYELTCFMPSDKVKSTKEYKEYTDFIKTAKLRENLAMLKRDNLVLEDNKKTKVAAAKGKTMKRLVAKAFDAMIEKNNKKIEAKEKEIAKRCGESK